MAYLFKREETLPLSSESGDHVENQTDYYLETLISDAFKGKGFQKITELFQDNVVCSSQRCSKVLLNQLDRLINKELDRNEFKHVSLLMKCIQYFCKTEYQEGSSLIQQGLVSKMVLWFERAMDFLQISGTADSSISTLVEDFYDTALVICKCNCEEGKKQLLDSFLFRLGLVVTEKWAMCHLRLEALRTLNCILDSISREDKKKLHSSEEMCSLMDDLARTIFEAGDYDIQVAISEALCRMMPKKNRDHFANRWFDDNFLADAFKAIKDKDFETDCRKFLNCLNSRLDDKRGVYTFPCNKVFADMDELCKPQDDKLEAFWIDFNVGSQSVSFYLNNTEGSLWDSIRLQKEVVNNYLLIDVDGQKLCKIYMKTPLTINNKEITKVKIYFSPEHDVKTALQRVFGKEIEICRAPAGRNETVALVDETTQVSDAVQQNKYYSGTSALVGFKTRRIWYSLHFDKKRMLHMGTPPYLELVNFSIQHAFWNKLTTSTKSSSSSPTARRVCGETSIISAGFSQEPEHRYGGTQHTDSTDVRDSGRLHHKEEESLGIDVGTITLAKISSETASTQKSLFTTDSQEALIESVPIQAVIPIPGEAKPAMSTPTAKGVKSPLLRRDDIALSEIATEVSEAKKKILVQKSRSLRANETSRLAHSPVSPDLGQVLYDGHNSGNYKKHLFSESNGIVSNSQSEKSWVLEFQKKSLPKSADYSRKKTRIKSKLKVLPLSSGSSDEQQNTGSASKFTSLKKDYRQEKGKAKSLSSTELKLPGISALLTPGDSRLKSTSAVSLSDLDDQDIMDPLEDESSPGYSRHRESPSKEYPEGITTLHISGLSREEKVVKPIRDFGAPDSGVLCEDVFSEPCEEDLGESGIISAFESFTKDLKSKFMFRYKNMEMRAQNVLKTSHEQVSTLLSEIHQCRLRKLQHFQKIVVNELSSLETETQALKELEKSTLDFWQEQSVKINKFCYSQKERINSVDSAFEERMSKVANVMQKNLEEEKLAEVEEDIHKKLIN
ncbi:synaptonemal complex protein 2-like [Discoglossus pictus]